MILIEGLGTRKEEILPSLEKTQESSNAPHSKSSTVHLSLPQSNKKESIGIAEKDELRHMRDGGRRSLTQEQKDHASRSRQGTIPDVGSAGSGPYNKGSQVLSNSPRAQKTIWHMSSPSGDPFPSEEETKSKEAALAKVPRKTLNLEGATMLLDTYFTVVRLTATLEKETKLKEASLAKVSGLTAKIEEEIKLKEAGLAKVSGLTANIEEETKLKEAALAEVSRLTAKLEETKSKEAGLARIFTRLKKKPKLEDVALDNVSGLTTRLEETKSKEAALAKVSGLTAKIEEETKLKEAALAKVSGLTAKLEETESKEAALTRIFTLMTRLKKKPKLKDVALANVSGLITELEETESKEAALTKVSGLTPELQEEKEAALTKGSKPNSSSDQASPVLIPRATSTMDWQTNAQRLKYEVNRDALYTLSRNIYHWILRGVRGCLVQSYYCSQSTLMKTCDRIRGRRRIFWTCVSRNSRQGNSPSANSPCIHGS